MKYKRFFAFGCSFTKYVWPTWADYIGLVIKPYYNFGGPGRGNIFISHQIIRANEYYKFNEEDLVIVAWSCPFRFDMLFDLPKNKWAATYFKKNDLYKISHELDNILSDDALISFTIDNIISTGYLLKTINCSFYFTSLSIDINSKNNILELVQPMYSSIKKLPWVNSISTFNTSEGLYLEDFYDGTILDNHPSPINHYNFSINELVDLVGFNQVNKELLKSKMIKWQSIFAGSPPLKSKQKFLNRYYETFKLLRENNIPKELKLYYNKTDMHF